MTNTMSDPPETVPDVVIEIVPFPDMELESTPAARSDVPRGETHSTETHSTETHSTETHSTEPHRGSAEDGGLRSVSVVSRVVLVALIGVITAALIAAISVWAVADVASSTDSVARLAEAKRVNADVLSELHALDVAGPTETASHAQNVIELSSQVDAATRSEFPGSTTRGARQAQQRYLDAERGGTASSGLFETAVLERTQLGARIADRQTALIDGISTTRSTAIIVVMALLALGSAAVVLVARRVGRSIIDPVRLLGRHIRRFGDGDNEVRAMIAPDEVGTLARSFNAMADQVGERVQHLHDNAERGAKLRMIGEALDQAENESDLHRIVENALAILTPGMGGELLLNDGTDSKLWRVAVNPIDGPGGCPVETAEGCVAMRRAQPMVWDSPDAINACPKLRDRPGGPCAAACVPVSANGKMLGVIHVSSAEHHPPSPETVDQLVTLAGQIGTRLGAMRTLESTRLQASTDGLTGLANRRMLESRLGDLLRTRTPFVLAVADLDKFKELNDRYGHEFGDRALQLFAKVLEGNVRGHDLVARFGGEEFVLVYPEMSVKPSMEVIERIRAALARALETANFPQFTCSFGVAHSTVADSVEGIIRIADAGLLMAKELGRNRVVYADEELAAEVFGGTPAPAPVPDSIESPSIEVPTSETSADEPSD